jgi:predicted Zn-dependent protease
MMQTENGLAMVLSHEMGHQYKRHPLRGLGRGVVVGLALLVMTGLDGGNWASSLISDTTMLGNLAYSRSQEAEADHIGVQLLSKTFGHAAGASEFFHLIQQRGLTMDAMAFFSAHPSTSSRIRELEQFETRLPGSVIPLPSFIKQETAGSETASGS